MFNMEYNIADRIYRGKDYNTGDWVYGHLLVRKNRYFIATSDALDFMVVNFGKATMKLIEVDPETVGIYTLHNDWFDIKVFTGDILETVSAPPSVYSTETCTLVLFNKQSGMYFADGLFEIPPYEFRYCRVIGNMYDNPELLELVALDLSYYEDEEDAEEIERRWRMAIDGSEEYEHIDLSAYRRDCENSLPDDEEDDSDIEGGFGRWVAGNFVRWDGVVARECDPDRIPQEDDEEDD